MKFCFVVKRKGSFQESLERIVLKSTTVGVGIAWAFVMTAVYRTDSDAYRMKSCNALFLLYLDVEETSEKKKKRKKHKAREMTESTL